MYISIVFEQTGSLFKIILVVTVDGHNNDLSMHAKELFIKNSITRSKQWKCVLMIVRPNTDVRIAICLSHCKVHKKPYHHLHFYAHY